MRNDWLDRQKSWAPRKLLGVRRPLEQAQLITIGIVEPCASIPLRTDLRPLDQDTLLRQTAQLAVQVVHLEGKQDRARQRCPGLERQPTAAGLEQREGVRLVAEQRRQTEHVGVPR